MTVIGGQLPITVESPVRQPAASASVKDAKGGSFSQKIDELNKSEALSKTDDENGMKTARENAKKAAMDFEKQVYTILYKEVFDASLGDAEAEVGSGVYRQEWVNGLVEAAFSSDEMSPVAQKVYEEIMIEQQQKNEDIQQ